jgi:hypothetical protein
MIKINKKNINDISYWSNRYSSGDWVSKGGELQSEFFMQLIIDNLPEEVKFGIKTYGYNICDLGMGLGSGTEILKNTFKNSKVFGLDFTDVASVLAKELHPTCEFKSGQLTEKVDVCINSNSLEHVDDYMQAIINDLENTNKYYIILVPFNENENTIPEHVIVFDNINNFPEEVNGFKRIFAKEISTIGSGYWHGSQLLVIYSKENIKIETQLDKIQNENLTKVQKSKGGRPKKTN